MNFARFHDNSSFTNCDRLKMLKWMLFQPNLLASMLQILEGNYDCSGSPSTGNLIKISWIQMRHELVSLANRKTGTNRLNVIPKSHVTVYKSFVSPTDCG